MSAMSERAAVIDQLITDLPPEDLKALADRLASQVGYVLEPEPAHPDGPAQGPGPGEAVADGWVMVPREPTIGMLRAWSKAEAETPIALDDHFATDRAAYRAMIAAAPSPPVAADAEKVIETGVDIQVDLSLLGGLVLHLEEGFPLKVGNPRALAAALRNVLSHAYPDGSPVAAEPGAGEAAADDEARYRQRIASDLATVVARDLDPDFPNYADWSVTLPAGHWRDLVKTLAATPTREADHERP